VICNDETRFHLNGVFFESDGSKARLVSTDGDRTAVRADCPEFARAYASKGGGEAQR
jgi:DNA polymerase III sliding clamp (beta) subunit (PCNA family)